MCLQAGYPPALAFQMALDAINADTSLLPNHQLVGWINSTDQETGTAIASAYFQLTSAKVSGIVGAYNSDYSQGANYICRIFNTPQLSYGSLSHVFDDKLYYKTFFRGLPNIYKEVFDLFLRSFLDSSGFYS
jgi:ABC-type branched-subunit amino acid transport system substrate-binding protein